MLLNWLTHQPLTSCRIMNAVGMWSDTKERTTAKFLCLKYEVSLYWDTFSYESHKDKLLSRLYSDMFSYESYKDKLLSQSSVTV
jgi:hypothetical protein